MHHLAIRRTCNHNKLTRVESQNQLFIFLIIFFFLNHESLLYGEYVNSSFLTTSAIVSFYLLLYCYLYTLCIYHCQFTFIIFAYLITRRCNYYIYKLTSSTYLSTVTLFYNLVFLFNSFPFLLLRNALVVSLCD